MTAPGIPPGTRVPPDRPLGGGRDASRFEGREARRLAVRLAAAQRRLGDPADVGSLEPSPPPATAIGPELGAGALRGLLGRLPVTWMRRRDRD